MKLWKFPSLSMVNPTEVPEFEMPFMLVPAPALVPGVRPVEVGEREAAGPGRGDGGDDRAGAFGFPWFLWPST